jgi:hypothetical protein
MDWTLQSPHLDVEDFTAFIKPSEESAPRPKDGKVPFNTASARLDQFLHAGIVHVQIDAADLRYKKFTGAKATAELLFDKDEIRLDKLTLQQGSGTLSLHAVLQRGSKANNLTLESNLDQVDLSRLFTSFHNFGQGALLDKNLKGLLTAAIRLTGSLDSRAEMVPGSLKGTINFKIQNGQLIDFEPMEKVQEKFLPKKDFSDIHFDDLQNQLDLDTTTFTIHRMAIQSTAFILFAEGVYDIHKGADLSLQIPLSNLRDRVPDIPLDPKSNRSHAGISLHLRARTGEDGKLNLTWDPFHKGGKDGGKKDRKK